MGICVDLYKYDKQKLINEILRVGKIEEKEENLILINFILDCFGDTIGEKYILLNNEFWQNGNCYYNISTVFEKVFNIPDENDFFGNVFCYPEYQEEMICYKEEYDVLEEIEEKFGIKIEFEEE